MLSDEIRIALLSDPSRAAKQDRAFLRFRCPRHEDSNPSAWMREGAWGCFACDFEEPITTLAAEVGVELRGTGPGLAPAVRQRRQIATHPYREANGTTRYFRDRFNSKPKVQPRRLDGVRTMEGVDPLLYRLPELIAAREQNREILFVEGESCCDVLAEHGFEATTSGGVTSWRSDFAEHFRGARVVLWPDADEPGERFAGTVAADLAAVVKELRVLRFDGKPKGWDAADFFAEGGKPEQLDVLLADAPPWHPVTPEAETNGLRILTDSEIENVPKPDWLWENRLPMMALAVLFGPPGAGKSFLALLLAMSVASGFRALGESVRRGPVVYVAPEGSAGMGARVKAWKQHHGFHGTAGVHFIPSTISLLDDGEVLRLVEVIRTLRPVLVIFDTLARSLPGGDENSAQDMGRAIANADRVRTATNATVLLVHHTNAGGERERGSTALRGAADTMLQVSAADGMVTVECAKQKDAPAFDRMELALLKVADSAVITARSELQLPADALTDFHRKILWSLRKDFLEEGASATEWQKATNVPERRFYEARTWLYNNGYVTRDKKGRGARYTLTDKAERVFTAVTADNCGITAPHEAAVTAAERGSLRTPQQRSNTDAGKEAA